MKIPSSIILLTSTLVTLPFALAKPIYEDTQLDFECANKHCGTFQKAVLKCAVDTYNPDIVDGKFENLDEDDQDDLRQYIDCYCDDVANLWQQYVPPLEFSLNCRIHEESMLMFGSLLDA